MSFSRPRVPLSLPVATVVLLVLGLLVNPYVQANFSEEQLADNVLLGAIPFILIFVSIILAFMTLVWAVASALNGNVPRRIYRPVELALMVGIALGTFGMFQPWIQALFSAGFYLLLICTLAFILWTHITPEDAQRQENLGSLAVSEFEQRGAQGTGGN